MNKKTPLYIWYIYLIWSLVIIIAVVATLRTTTVSECRYYDEKIEASNITESCFKRIKKYKIDNNIETPKEDVLESGMLGKHFSYITTTTGVVESKRTSVNPNFGAVVIDMFKEAGVKKGDEVGVVFSGSFPAINIAVMAACDVFDLKTCIMASIGASSYGANDPDFNFFDMANLLYNEGLLKTNIDYISLGGSHDMGDDFWEGVSEPIIERINQSSAKYISIRDYEENLNYRMNEFKKTIPNMKLFINVGGNIVAMGLDEEAYIYNNGLVKPNYLSTSLKKGNYSKKGLIERYLDKGIPIIHMLNLKSIALKYDLPYDPVVAPTIGSGNVYFEKDYRLSIPITSIVVSVIILAFFGIMQFREKKEKKHELYK